MTLLLQPVATGSPLARRNPAAKLTAAAVVMLGLLASGDWLSATGMLAVEAVVVAGARIGVTALWRRGWPLAVGLTGVLVTNLVLARSDGGSTLLALGPVTITGGELATAVAITLRLAAVAVPGLLFVATTDPVDLADSLVQQWHAPPRFAYGALAALRLLPLLAQEWRTIGSARRARGVGAGRNPVRALQLFGSQVFALLVVAIRRATRLAAAMDARGFDAGLPRTSARTQRVTAADRSLVAASLLAVLMTVGVSVAAGSWRLVVS